MQFYLGTWLHRRGDGPSHKGGQRSHAAALGGYILVNAGQTEKFVLEPLNFADDVVRDGDGRKRAVFKNWSDTLFVNLD